jgi:nucleoside-diphosphate-sugar epimerase
VRERGATPTAGDLDEPESLENAFRASRADALINLASLGFGHAPAVLAALENSGIKRAIFVSTTAIFTGLNAASRSVRISAEEAIRRSRLDWTILRPTMIYGTPADRNMFRLVRAVRRWPVMLLPGGGRGLQQPVHVDDLAKAVVTTLGRPVTIHRSYDLAGPRPLTFRETVEAAAGAVGKRPLMLPIPMSLVIVVARSYERLSRAPRLRTEQFERLAENKAFDIGPAMRDLDFNPRPFEVGISEEAALA